MTNSGDKHTDECDASIDQQVIPNGQGITINYSWSRYHSRDGITLTVGCRHIITTRTISNWVGLFSNNTGFLAHCQKTLLGKRNCFFFGGEGFLEHMTSNKLRIRNVKLYPISKYPTM